MNPPESLSSAKLEQMQALIKEVHELTKQIKAKIDKKKVAL
jgi:hypothetical protein